MAQEQNEIMSQEDIEALITNSKSEKTSETPKMNPLNQMIRRSSIQTDLKEMFEEQSSAVTKPETEDKNENQNDKSLETPNIPTEDETTENSDLDDSSNINSLNTNNEESTSESNNEESTSESDNEESESDNPSQNPPEDDSVEALIKKEKAQQQQAKSDFGVKLIFLRYSIMRLIMTLVFLDPTSVLSQDVTRKRKYY